MAAENKVEILLTAKDQASKKIDKNTRSMKEMTGASKTLGKSLSVLKGIAITAFAGWGVSKVGTSIAKIGSEFKYTMAIVRGVSRATAKEYEALEAIARRMGETTEWSATEAAEALKFLSMAGFSAAQSIKALPATLNLATAGNIDLGRTADIVTNALTAMRLPVEELTRVSDVFIQTVISSNTNMEMMAESFKYVAPVAAGFGIKIERLSALIGLLGNAGIQGSMAGTQLSMAMMRAREVFEKYGVSTRRADGSTKDFVDALELLEARGGDASEVLDSFAMRSGKAALALLGQGVPAIMKYIKEIEKAEGATKKLADIIRNTAKIDWKLFMAVLESVAIDIWEKYEKSAVAALKASAKWIGKNREKIVELSGAVGKLADKIKTVLLPVLDRVWKIISYDPAMLEWGLVGFVLMGKKGAAIGAALGHMMSWLSNLCKSLDLVSTGVLKLSDVANATFKELQELVKSSNMPSVLRILELQAKKLRKEIEYLRRATEGKIFFFGGDKRELAEKQLQLREIQDRMASIREERFIESLVTFKMPTPPVVPKLPPPPSPEFSEAQIKIMQEQEDFAIKMSEIAAKRIKDREELEKNTIESFRKARMTETELALDALDKQFLDYDAFVKDKAALDKWYIEQYEKIPGAPSPAGAPTPVIPVFKQIQDWVEAVSGSGEMWEKFINKSGNEFLKKVNIASSNIVIAWGGLIIQIAGLLQSIVELPAKLVDTISDLFNAIGNFGGLLTEALNNLIDSVFNMIAGLGDVFTKLIPKLITAIPEIIKAFVKAIPVLINAIIDSIPLIIEAIVRDVPLIIVEIIKLIPTIIGKLIGAIPDIVVGIVEGIGSGIKGLWDGLFGGGTEIKTIEVKGIMSKEDKNRLLSLFKGLIERIADYQKSREQAGWDAVDFAKRFNELNSQLEELNVGTQNYYEQSISIMEEQFEVAQRMEELQQEQLRQLQDVQLSIGNLILELTGGRLAPVQSMEFFEKQYQELLSTILDPTKEFAHKFNNITTLLSEKNVLQDILDDLNEALKIGPVRENFKEIVDTVINSLKAKDVSPDILESIEKISTERPDLSKIAADFEAFIPEYLEFMGPAGKDYATLVASVIGDLEQVQGLIETEMDSTEKGIWEIASNTAEANIHLVDVMDNLSDQVILMAAELQAVSPTAYQQIKVKVPGFLEGIPIIGDIVGGIGDVVGGVGDFFGDVFGGIGDFFGFQKGGLAVQPSIAGEIGPEWVVPTYEPQRSSFLRDVGADPETIGDSIARRLSGISLGGGESHIHLYIDGEEISGLVAEQMTTNSDLIEATRRAVAYGE